MKVLLLNGSPNEKKCTYTALSAVAKELEENGIDTEIFHIDSLPVQKKISDGYEPEAVKEIIEKIKEADGFVFGSPVHYAGISAVMKLFLDYFFWRQRALFSHKPAAVLVSCRRGGSTAALEQLEKHIAHDHMPLISSGYWNMIHGNTVEEVLRDEEGIRTMKMIGRNMAWLLKCIEAGKEKGISLPEIERGNSTNFIR